MSDIVAHPEDYFRLLVRQQDSLLNDLEAEALGEGIPIVGPLVGELLFILARAIQARQILELGTATGYSAIFLARACAPWDGRVITLENDRAMAARAQANFQKAGLTEHIELRLGDALQELAQMEEFFDMVFMDIDKQDYHRVLPHCQCRLKSGGLLVADNVAFQDADAFNRAIAGHPGWRSVALFSFLPYHSPEKDGLCLALRL
ncbi:MAG: O-methyltransferase [Desulfobacterales bacterium]|nr:MAG: O-methyltransferase [Desulfobacterales bacterium]